MESDTVIAAFIGAVVVALGWFATYFVNIKHNIAKKRTECRMDALNSVLSIWSFIEKNSAPFKDPTFAELLESARRKIQLCGYQDEIDNMESFITHAASNNLDEANSSLKKLIKLARDRIRKEIGLPPIAFS